MYVYRRVKARSLPQGGVFINNAKSEVRKVKFIVSAAACCVSVRETGRETDRT